MDKKALFLLLAWALSRPLSAQMDTVPPQVQCKNMVEIFLPFCFSLSVSAESLLENYSDNVTPAADMALGVRRLCTADGFPENQNQLTFWYTDLWAQSPVEVWARDQAGHTNSCVAWVFPNEYSQGCDPVLSAMVWTPDSQTVAGVSVELLGTHCQLDTLQITALTWNIAPEYAAWLQLGTFAPTGYAITATPSKNDFPLNGVSTLDLALISKHILGIETFDSPYKIIAADANQDGQVTTFDIFILKQLLLGNTTALPNGRSWRFLPYDFVFPNPANPFQTPFPERIESPNTAEPAPNSFTFRGIKIGDVNHSADPGQ